MDLLSGAVIGLAMTVLGMVWRASGLVSELRRTREEIAKLHGDFETFSKTFNSLERKVAVLEERLENTGRFRLPTPLPDP